MCVAWCEWSNAWCGVAAVSVGGSRGKRAARLATTVFAFELASHRAWQCRTRWGRRVLGRRPRPALEDTKSLRLCPVVVSECVPLCGHPLQLESLAFVVGLDPAEPSSLAPELTSCPLQFSPQ
jgi:hypothetical protein